MHHAWPAAGAEIEPPMISAALSKGLRERQPPRVAARDAGVALCWPPAPIRTVALAAALLLACTGCASAAAAAASPEPLYLLGIPVDFILFALTLLGVALFHHHTLQVALTGLAAIVALQARLHRLQDSAQGLGGLALHMQHEWVILANLFLLLMGFALLSRHFEESKLPDVMPAFLPDDWKGGLRAARDRVRPVELSRQYRRGADRRHDGAARCSAARCTSAISPPSSPLPMPAAPAASSAIPPRP